MQACRKCTTYPIEAPKKDAGEKSHPYSLEDAKRTLLPQIDAANQAFAALPAQACPDDLAVAVLTLQVVGDELLTVL